MLEVRDLTVRYGTLCVADSVSFSVQPGEWLMIAGPNGAGKSTVLNAVAQATPYTGQVLLNNRDARRIRPRERAKMLGILGQSHAVGYAFTVEEIVRLGRYAYSGPFSGGDGAEAMSEIRRCHGPPRGGGEDRHIGTPPIRAVPQKGVQQLCGGLREEHGPGCARLGGLGAEKGDPLR